MRTLLVITILLGGTLTFAAEAPKLGAPDYALSADRPVGVVVATVDTTAPGIPVSP